MPITNAGEDGGMRPIDHLMSFVGFRHDNTQEVMTFPDNPMDKVVKETFVREIYFKAFPGVWIAADGSETRQGNAAAVMGNSDRIPEHVLRRMSIRGLQETARELGAQVVPDVDQQVNLILQAQNLKAVGAPIPKKQAPKQEVARVLTNTSTGTDEEKEIDADEETGTGTDEGQGTGEEAATDPAVGAGAAPKQPGRRKKGQA